MNDARLGAGEILASRYKIVRLIGRGGMGEVYHAEDLELGAQIALKLVLPEVGAEPDVLDRFRREVHLARRVTHPNVCRIFDLGYHVAGPGHKITFLTMELLSGETLADRLSRTGRIPVEEALPLVTQMAAALAAAHAAGVIHRDFKSSNVMLAPEGGAKITDFGIARSMSGEDNARITLTSAGAMFGTPAYMAPEQIEGGEITAATDIYALGAVMYEMITGVLPFAADTPLASVVRRLKEAPASPRVHVPGLEPRWERVILRCLEREPAARFANAADIGKALSGEVVRHPVRRRTVVMAASAFAALLAVSGLAYFWRTGSIKQPAQAPAVAQFGWRQAAFPADASVSKSVVAAGSTNPLEILLFGPSVVHTWEPGQNALTASPITFSAAARADCPSGLWLVHDDHRQLTKWDAAKQRALATITLPWSFNSAGCLDEKATRWGFLVSEGEASRWIEWDAGTNRTLRSVRLEEFYFKATLDPQSRWVVLMAKDAVSVRGLDRLEEIFRDTPGETLISPASSWSESGRYLALGFKQLAVYDLKEKRRTKTLTTTGWITDIGWIGDSGLSVVDDRGRFYWTADLSKAWQVKQEAQTQGVYQAFWIASHYRWVVIGSEGKGLEWEYVTPTPELDLDASPLDIWSIAADPVETKAAIAGKDTRISILDLIQKKVVRMLDGHTDGVPFLSFERSNRLISASDDKTIRIWDTASGKLLKTATGHQSLVNGLAISPNRQWLVSVSSDSKIKLWQLPELNFVKDIGTTPSGGAAAAFLRDDNERLAVSDWSGMVERYEGKPPDWSMKQQFRLSHQVVYMMCAGGNEWWAAALEEDEAGLWRVPGNDLAKAVRISQWPAYYCSTAADGQLTAVLFANRIEVRSNTDGGLVAIYHFSAREGATVAISDHPSLVIAGFAKGHLMAWPLGGRR